MSEIIEFSRKSILILCCLFLVSSCGDPLAKLPGGGRDTPESGRERAKKNLEEGKGISLGNAMKNRKTTYEFSSSNPMWRATFDVIDFMPLSSVNYSGGIIITDWYSEQGNAEESIKITIRFLSNEVRSDAIDVDIFYKKCIAPNNCKINKQDGQLKKEITRQILAKAAIYQKQSKDKNYKPYRMSGSDNERE